MIPAHMSLRDLYALAYIEGLDRKAAERHVTGRTHTVRLDDTGRPPYVPLRPNGGDRG
jgi:hypothetical protein